VCVEQSVQAQELGAGALLMVTPYYNKTTQAGLIAHYTKVADAVRIPIIIYNVPSRTGLNVLPSTMHELSKHPLIRGIKEASANIEQITALMRLCGDSIALYSGNDDHVLPLLSLGGQGVISTVANIAPREAHNMVAAYMAGDIAASRTLQFKLNPLVKQLFTEVNPIPVKAALQMMGKCSGELRLPLVEISDANRSALRREMQAFGLL
jgi:4-hydroxy-tetrahydrodipicolinate synthase